MKKETYALAIFVLTRRRALLTANKALKSESGASKRKFSWATLPGHSLLSQSRGQRTKAKLHFPFRGWETNVRVQIERECPNQAQEVSGL